MITTFPHLEFHAALGRVVRARREAQGKTQSELAAAVGLSQSEWSKIERGLVPLAAATLNVAAVVLDTRAGLLLDLAAAAAERPMAIDFRDPDAAEFAQDVLDDLVALRAFADCDGDAGPYGEEIVERLDAMIAKVRRR